MSSCVFCDIVEGTAPASIVYRDTVAVAFMSIGPVNPGHLMVVPRRHASALADLDEATGAHLFRVTMRMAGAIRRSGVRCEGVNLFLADGEAAFQEIPHVHMHVFPRFKGDSFSLVANWAIKPPREKLDEVAARIRKAYESLAPNRHG